MEAWNALADKRTPAVSAGAVPLVRPAVLHGALVVGALGLWAIALTRVDLREIGDLGLLDALPVTWFVAFGLLLAGFAHAVSRKQPTTPLLAVYVVALILVLHGTTPLLYDEPRYAWTFKHLGVIDWIAASGHVDRTLDIYNNWPAFFAVNAWLSSVTGVSPMEYAEWSQVFFELLNAAAILFTLRALTIETRLIWLATWLFLLSNWIAQDYLAPQAFVFPLATVLLGLCLRCGPRSARVPRPRAGLVTGGLCYLAIVATHQLTPIVAIIGVTVLAVAARRVPLWVPLAMLVIEAAWVAHAWGFLHTHINLLSFDLAGNAHPTPTPHAATGFKVVSWASRALVAVMFALAAAGFWRRYRSGRGDLAPTVLLAAAMPAAAVLNYGGEGGMRTYLFALPWLAFLAAALCLEPRRRAPRTGVLAVAAVAAVSALVGTLLLFAYYGRELMDHISRDDVRVALWFERHAPVGSARVQLTANIPERVTARYAALRGGAYSNILANHRPFAGRLLGARDVPALELYLARLGSTSDYVLLSPSQEHEARMLGSVAPHSTENLGRALSRSPHFKAVYRSGQAVVYLWTP
jgi:hypothetical protein